MKPPDIFARDDEWATLDRHATDGRARLGVVTGRRRVGKTFLLRRLVERHHGLLISSLEEAKEPALRRFAAALGRHHGIELGTPVDWAAALRQVTDGPLAVPLLVIDELPYLLAHSPELESILQHLVDESRDRRGTRVIVAGSSLAVMGGLLDGGRPLRGRADLQLVVQPFDFRVSAAYWGASDPAIAFRLDAILGGAAGYRSMAPDVPADLERFDEWVLASIVNPAAALYHEDAYLLGEDRRLSDRAMYSSILRAIAHGDHRPSRIGARVGRAQTSLSHPFRVLIDAGFVKNMDGVLSGRDPLYQLTDPVVSFLLSCVEPWRSMVDEGRGKQAWEIAQPAWHAQVLGPHLEHLARVWTATFAAADSIGGSPGIVGRAELADAEGRATREIDVAVLAPGETVGKSARVQAIGEAKLSADMDALAHLDRSARLLERRGNGLPRQLLIFCESATSALRDAVSTRDDVSIVNLDRLYLGS